MKRFRVTYIRNSQWDNSSVVVEARDLYGAIRNQRKIVESNEAFAKQLRHIFIEQIDVEDVRQGKAGTLMKVVHPKAGLISA